MADAFELIRKRLASTRKRKDLTLREAADEIGVSAATISRIERGAGQPDTPTLRRLLRWLELDPSYVLGQPDSAPGSTPERVSVLLRADKKLDARTAQALAKIFESAYEELVDDE